MVNDVYDSFIDPMSWPEPEERKRLAVIFGFETTVPRSDRVRDADVITPVLGASWARSGHASARSGRPSSGRPKPRRSNSATGLGKRGARDRARTGDPHVGNVSEEPGKPDESS